MRLVIVGLLFLAATSASASEVKEKYLCIGSKSVGFRVPEGRSEYENTTFKVDKDRFLVDTVKREVKRIGENDPIYTNCQAVVGGLVLLCTGMMRTMNFNFHTLRFSEADLAGTLAAVSEKTPYLTVGTCSPL